jgi:hypothetical protein
VSQLREYCWRWFPPRSNLLLGFWKKRIKNSQNNYLHNLQCLYSYNLTLFSQSFYLRYEIIDQALNVFKNFPLQHNIPTAKVVHLTTKPWSASLRSQHCRSCRSTRKTLNRNWQDLEARLQILNGSEIFLRQHRPSNHQRLNKMLESFIQTRTEDHKKSGHASLLLATKSTGWPSRSHECGCRSKEGATKRRAGQRFCSINGSWQV